MNTKSVLGSIVFAGVMAWSSAGFARTCVCTAYVLGSGGGDARIYYYFKDDCDIFSQKKTVETDGSCDSIPKPANVYDSDLNTACHAVPTGTGYFRTRGFFDCREKM
jgi:hypothetical protein